MSQDQDVRNLETTNLEKRFSQIYEEDLFGGSESRSGEGSNLSQTSHIREAIPQLLKDLKAHSLLDAPCGDWHWMQHVDLPVDSYIGVDIVPNLAVVNNDQFGREGQEFLCLDLASSPLPKVDVIFSRDCLVHLSLDTAQQILTNFKKSGSTYLLTTTFPGRDENSELEGPHSFWRPLNLQIAPFKFPEPLRLLNERCTEEAGTMRDKSLALWRLADL